VAIDYTALPVTKDEPLSLELESFFSSIVSRQPAKVTGAEGLAALEAAHAILDKIEEHGRLVTQALAENQ